MQIERTESKNLVENGLPDGSRLIVDSKNEKVYALNATAGAAWDACANQTTLTEVAESMRKSCDLSITDELAYEAIEQLRDRQLLKVSGGFQTKSRRAVLAGLSAVALPLVVSMTLSDQRALAQSANSNPAPGPSGNRPNAHVSHESGISL